MAFNCPYCGFRIVVKTPPKPGKYNPKCPSCGGRISLTIPAEPDEPWLAEKTADAQPPMDSTLAGTSVPAKATASEGNQIDATLAPPQKPKPNSPAPAPAVAKHSAEPESTIADPNATVAPPPKPKKKDDQTIVSPPATSKSDDLDATTAPAAKTRVDTGNDETIAPESLRKNKAKIDDDVPNPLGNYELVKELGRGGMGAVYLARQVSLDRPVALKIMNKRWANDPIFIARFTREAYAAAQLTHHNVVQIYDFGLQDNINYFSMEFVDGKSLGDTIKKSGPLSVENAVGYILQAARGLKFAHDRGMIHRDIKPDNLMLNNQGIVKVADLGLVKTPGMTAADDKVEKTEADFAVGSMSALRSMSQDITDAKSAMGSPAYMSPEQCRDAANVDVRADIYSLGCTLYALVNGKPPFTGSSVLDVMAQHATAEPPPLKNIPPKLNDIIMKMLAKDPAQRHQDMGELIADLEGFLGRGSGAFKPSEEQLTTFENLAQGFRNSPKAKLRSKMLLAAGIGAIIATLLAGLIGGIWGAAIAIGFAIQTIIAYQVIVGILQGTYLFRKIREWAFGAKISDWLMAIVGGGITLGVLFLLGLLWPLVGTVIAAIGLAFVFHMVLDKAAQTSRKPILEETQKQLKRLRLAGMEEEELRKFVAGAASPNWEEFYEALFGYEAKLQLRPVLKADNPESNFPKYGAWRDVIITRIEKVQQARKTAKEQKLLQKLEAKKLQAQGVDKKEAEAKAEAAAVALVEQANEFKAAEEEIRALPDKEKTIALKARPNLRNAIRDIEKGAPKERPRKQINPIKSFGRLLFGLKTRFLIAAALIFVGALWVRQTLRNPPDLSKLNSSDNAADAAKAAKEVAGSLKPLWEVGRPVEEFGIFTNWVNTVNPLAAGLMLLSSLMFSRPRGVVLIALGALITVVVPILPNYVDAIPKEGFGPFKPHQAGLIAGTVFTLVGMILGRWKR